jgi:hypothetical protein
MLVERLAAASAVKQESPRFYLWGVSTSKAVPLFFDFWCRTFGVELLIKRFRKSIIDPEHGKFYGV